jgi:hypothetical protein
MTWNDDAIEGVIEHSGIEGTVTLGSLSNVRRVDRPDVNPDGSTTGKPLLRFGGKRRVVPENPDYRVTPTREGWTIQVNGRNISQEVDEQEGDRESRTQEFGRRFNGAVRGALRDCVLEEKLGPIKNPNWVDDLIGTVWYPSANAVLASILVNFKEEPLQAGAIGLSRFS